MINLKYDIVGVNKFIFYEIGKFRYLVNNLIIWLIIKGIWLLLSFVFKLFVIVFVNLFLLMFG